MGIAVKDHAAPVGPVRFICDTCAGCHNKGVSICSGSKAAANGRSKFFFSSLGRGVHGAAADQDPTILTDRITRWAVLAADARVRRPTGGRYCAAADGDLAASGAESAVTNAGCAVCAGGRDFAAADGDLAAGSLCPAADARGLIAAGCVYRTARDGDCGLGAGIPFILFSTVSIISCPITNARALRATSCSHGAAVYLNRNPIPEGSAADAGRLITASCSHIAAVDGNGTAIALHPAADAGTVCPAGCVYRTAVDDDVAACGRSSADACGHLSAGCGHGAAVDGNTAAKNKFPFIEIGAASDSGVVNV